MIAPFRIRSHTIPLSKRTEVYVWNLNTEISYGNTENDRALNKTIVLHANRACQVFRKTLTIQLPHNLAHLKEDLLFAKMMGKVIEDEIDKGHKKQSLESDVSKHIYRPVKLRLKEGEQHNNTHEILCHYHCEFRESNGPYERDQLIKQMQDLQSYLESPAQMWFESEFSIEFGED